MIQIRPQESFPIVYRIADPTDSATYYVQAVIRNSVTGAIIKINNLPYINLVQDGTDAHRFSKTIQAPNDPSGLGFYIDVTVKVYNDSGYSSQNQTYLEKNDTYLVQERWSIAHGSGGGWMNWDEKLKKVVDYDRIGKMLTESFDKLPPNEIPNLDLGLVLEGHKRLEGAIKGIPTPAKVDFKSFADMIVRDISQQIGAIKFPVLDLSPIIKKIDDIKIPNHPNLLPHFESVKSELKSAIQEISQNLPSTKYTELMDVLTSRITGSPKKEKEDPYKKRAENLKSR